MRIAIGIATRGRAAILREVLGELALQTRMPDRVIVCHVTPDDIAGGVQDGVALAHPDCVVTTGTVLADGAKGPGISIADGRAEIDSDHHAGDPMAVVPHFNGYGCNMALRMKPLRAYRLRFDEELPLYAWYEDLDLTRRLGAHGTILRLKGNLIALGDLLRGRMHPMRVMEL